MAAISQVAASTPVLSSPSVDVQSKPSGSEVKTPSPMPQQQPVASPAGKPVTEQDVQKAVDQANQQMKQSHSKLTFGYEQRLNMLYVKVTDEASGEVIREIPSKDFVQHRLAMQEMVGVILDKKG